MSYTNSDKEWLAAHKPGFTDDDLESFVKLVGMGNDDFITLSGLEELRKQALYDLDKHKASKH
jgi:glycosylphosphatidylinositol transamidase (GPIT) subunit GPI8